MRVGLVGGEPVSPLSRVLVAADSANGISWELPIGPYLFVNLDLSIHLARMPEGEWVCLDAESAARTRGPRGWRRAGCGTNETGFGAGAQSLLVWAA